MDRKTYKLIQSAEELRESITKPATRFCINTMQKEELVKSNVNEKKKASSRKVMQTTSKR